MIVALRAISKELPQCLEILKYLSDLKHPNLKQQQTPKPLQKLTCLELPIFLDADLIILESLVRT